MSFAWRIAANQPSKEWMAWGILGRMARDLQAAIIETVETVPPRESLFQLATRVKRIADGKEAHNLEPVVRTWAEAWETRHPGRPSIDISAAIAEFETYLRRARKGRNPLPDAIAQAADPATWPQIDGESERLRHLLAICQRLAALNGGTFFIASTTAAKAVGCSQRGALYLLRRLVGCGFITPTGKYTWRQSPFYKLGPNGV